MVIFIQITVYVQVVNQKELAGLNKIPTGAGSGGWSWTNLRTINFFLQRYQRSELPAYKLEQYAGEAYFLKLLIIIKKYYFSVMCLG